MSKAHQSWRQRSPACLGVCRGIPKQLLPSSLDWNGKRLRLKLDIIRLRFIADFPMLAMIGSQNFLKIAALLFALTTIISSAFASSRLTGLPIFISITPGKFGGEARFVGKLRIENGCVVAVLGKRRATVLFDAGTTLGADLQSLSESGGAPILIGQSFAAATAVLRDNGRGWPIADIESFFGVNIPARCPHRAVIRLRRLEPINMDEH